MENPTAEASFNPYESFLDFSGQNWSQEENDFQSPGTGNNGVETNEIPVSTPTTKNEKEDQSVESEEITRKPPEEKFNQSEQGTSVTAASSAPTQESYSFELSLPPCTDVSPLSCKESVIASMMSRSIDRALESPPLEIRAPPSRNKHEKNKKMRGRSVNPENRHSSSDKDSVSRRDHQSSGGSSSVTSGHRDRRHHHGRSEHRRENNGERRTRSRSADPAESSARNGESRRSRSRSRSVEPAHCSKEDTGGSRRNTCSSKSSVKPLRRAKRSNTTTRSKDEGGSNGSSPWKMKVRMPVMEKIPESAGDASSRRSKRRSPSRSRGESKVRGSCRSPSRTRGESKSTETSSSPSKTQRGESNVRGRRESHSTNRSRSLSRTRGESTSRHIGRSPSRNREQSRERSIRGDSRSTRESIARGSGRSPSRSRGGSRERSSRGGSRSTRESIARGRGRGPSRIRGESRERSSRVDSRSTRESIARDSGIVPPSIRGESRERSSRGESELLGSERKRSSSSRPGESIVTANIKGDPSRSRRGESTARERQISPSRSRTGSSHPSDGSPSLTGTPSLPVVRVVSSVSLGSPPHGGPRVSRKVSDASSTASLSGPPTMFYRDSTSSDAIQSPSLRSVRSSVSVCSKDGFKLSTPTREGIINSTGLEVMPSLLEEIQASPVRKPRQNPSIGSLTDVVEESNGQEIIIPTPQQKLSIGRRDLGGCSRERNASRANAQERRSSRARSREPSCTRKSHGEKKSKWEELREMHNPNSDHHSKENPEQIDGFSPGQSQHIDFADHPESPRNNDSNEDNPQLKAVKPKIKPVAIRAPSSFSSPGFINNIPVQFSSDKRETISSSSMNPPSEHVFHSSSFHFDDAPTSGSGPKMVEPKILKPVISGTIQTNNDMSISSPIPPVSSRSAASMDSASRDRLDKVNELIRMQKLKKQESRSRQKTLDQYGVGSPLARSHVDEEVTSRTGSIGSIPRQGLNMLKSLVSPRQSPPVDTVSHGDRSSTSKRTGLKVAHEFIQATKEKAERIRTSRSEISDSPQTTSRWKELAERSKSNEQLPNTDAFDVESGTGWSPATASNWTSIRRGREFLANAGRKNDQRRILLSDDSDDDDIGL